ncbi:hypothetical protein Cni_G18653 [Canna indica]|uniref:Uncharacterized protein n=1 Tax=Canna indica TaxID=4628 RepID=A0AAQ3QIZ1_9LILI|nr:hypothetical protein Cni_G18653 [Canna indica]
MHPDLANFPTENTAMARAMKREVAVVQVVVMEVGADMETGTVSSVMAEGMEGEEVVKVAEVDPGLAKAAGQGMGKVEELMVGDTERAEVEEAEVGMEVDRGMVKVAGLGTVKVAELMVEGTEGATVVGVAEAPAVSMEAGEAMEKEVDPDTVKVAAVTA